MVGNGEICWYRKKLKISEERRRKISELEYFSRAVDPGPDLFGFVDPDSDPRRQK